MILGKEVFGLKFINNGSVTKPRMKVKIYSDNIISDGSFDIIIQEIRWRFNFDMDVSNFCEEFKRDKLLGPIIEKWKGMKPLAAHSLYEIIVIYLLLQNTTVRRSVSMLENLFEQFGRIIRFDGKTISAFWRPIEIFCSSEEALKELKLGYRAKYLKRISESFTIDGFDERKIRSLSKDEIEKEMLKLYGIGPASVEYLLFEYFHFCDNLKTLPPWEQKIISRLIFNRTLVAVDDILSFFRENYSGWEKLSFHYIWEDLFWKRKREKIEWLNKEIRL